jgi:DNA modification methylase
MIKIYNDDCLYKIKDLEDNSIDSIVTDPPYGISFMGKKWDYDVPSVDIWKECYRVLKPGGHLLSFSGSRTYHRMAVNIEDAGFEIRDQIMWVYGSGFPKSLNVGKAIDKKLGNEREVLEVSNNGAGNKQDYLQSERSQSEAGMFSGDGKSFEITKGSSDYEGWGTALKPAHEPIVLARKPFKDTVANNVLEYGTGALNIDGCRVGDDGGTRLNPNVKDPPQGAFKPGDNTLKREFGIKVEKLGRWPANFIHDGLEEEWSKYFYCPKASKKDRNEGCEELEEKQYSSDGRETPNETAHQRNKSKANNNHPTVKPTELMRYLCRLVTPKSGVVLDPFMGSGSTGKAAVLEGFSFTGIELSEEYFNIAKTRIESLNEKNNKE